MFVHRLKIKIGFQLLVENERTTKQRGKIIETDNDLTLFQKNGSAHTHTCTAATFRCKGGCDNVYIGTAYVNIKPKQILHISMPWNRPETSVCMRRENNMRN